MQGVAGFMLSNNKKKLILDPRAQVLQDNAFSQASGIKTQDSKIQMTRILMPYTQLKCLKCIRMLDFLLPLVD